MRFRGWFGCSLWLLSACSAKPQTHLMPKQPAGTTFLTNANVVDVRTGTVRPHFSVLIEAGKITRVEPDGALTAPKNIITIDAQNRFVVPGFNDMHAHPYGDGGPRGAARLMLANGITGVRQMQGSDDMLAARQTGTLEPIQPAPALLGMPGAVLLPINARNAEEVAQEIAKQKLAGADFIKAVSINRDVFAAAQTEASRQGLPFVGHLPPGVDAVAASNAGMRAVEHLGPGAGLLIACSKDAAVLAAENAAQPAPDAAPKLPLMDRFFASKFRKKVINPLAEPDKARNDLTDKAVATFDAARCQAFAKLLVKNGTWQVPTLIRLHTQYFADAPEHQGNANLHYLDHDTVEAWKDVTETFTKNTTPQLKRSYESLYAAQIKMLKVFDDSGVGLLTGSDAPGGWVIPGFSLHEEFDLLEKAGLAPLKILQMTTLNAAQFLGRLDHMGTVQAGRDGDLVLLDGNPLESAQNLHKIAAVVRNGGYYDRATLDKMLDTARNL